MATNNIIPFIRQKNWAIAVLLGVVLFVGSLWISPKGEKEIALSKKIIFSSLAPSISALYIVAEKIVKRCPIFTTTWGKYAEPVIIYIALYVSAVPCLLIGDDFHGMLCMFGLCVWLFGLENSLNSVVDLNLVNVALSITVGLGSTQFQSHNNVTKILGYVFAFLVPFVITVLRCIFLQKKPKFGYLKICYEIPRNPNTPIDLMKPNRKTFTLDVATDEEVRAAIQANANQVKDYVRLKNSRGDLLTPIFKIAEQEPAFSHNGYFTVVAYEP